MAPLTGFVRWIKKLQHFMLLGGCLMTGMSLFTFSGRQVYQEGIKNAEAPGFQEARGTGDSHWTTVLQFDLSVLGSLTLPQW